MMQRNSFTISLAEKEDIPMIAALEAECFSAPWSEKAVFETMSREESVFLVAKEGEKVCGYVGCYYVLDEGYITNVAVSERFRRRGVARSLIEELCGIAKGKGLSFITLEVRSKNLAAIALYEGLGFSDVGLRPRFYTNPDDDARLMTYYIEK